MENYLVIIFDNLIYFNPEFNNLDLNKFFRNKYKIWKLKLEYQLLYYGRICICNIIGDISDIEYDQVMNKPSIYGFNRNDKYIYISESRKKKFRQQLEKAIVYKNKLIVKDFETLVGLYKMSIRFKIFTIIAIRGSDYYNKLVQLENQGLILDYMRDKYVLENGHELLDDFDYHHHVI